MKSIRDFNTSITHRTGGVTGSVRVQEMGEGGKYFQLKPSILDNPSTLRQIKAGSTDRENFGEVIASAIGLAFLGPQIVPEVSLVYDPARGRTSVASRYLEGDADGVRTLDAYGVEKGAILSAKRKHVRCVSGKVADASLGEFAVDGDIIGPLKQNLADAIVLSAIVGDHDVNPGNMLVITRDGMNSVARIDYGHAFNDLLNASKINGGQLEDRENPLLDFFNREKVAGLLGDPSKLWRDYPGMVPSQEMLNALRRFQDGYVEIVDRGVQTAKSEFAELLVSMKANKDYDGIAHVKSSLCAICKNISGKELNEALSEKMILDQAFAEIDIFTKRNCQNIKQVANVMELQLAVDDALKNGTALNPALVPKPRSRDYPLKDEKIQWLRTDIKEGFSGNFEDFIACRAGELIKQDPENQATLVANYRRLREACIQTTVEQDPTRHFRNQLRGGAAAQQEVDDQFEESDTENLISDLEDYVEVSSTPEEGFRKSNTDKLVSNLQRYIDDRISKDDKKGPVGYSKAEKIAAVNALIDALHHIPNAHFPGRYVEALKDGTVCEIISDFVQLNVPALSSAFKAERVDALLKAIENDHIPVIGPKEDSGNDIDTPDSGYVS